MIKVNAIWMTVGVALFAADAAHGASYQAVIGVPSLLKASSCYEVEVQFRTRESERDASGAPDSFDVTARSGQMPAPTAWGLSELPCTQTPEAFKTKVTLQPVGGTARFTLRTTRAVGRAALVMSGAKGATTYSDLKSFEIYEPRLVKLEVTRADGSGSALVPPGTCAAFRMTLRDQKDQDYPNPSGQETSVQVAAGAAVVQDYCGAFGAPSQARTVVIRSGQAFADIAVQGTSIRATPVQFTPHTPKVSGRTIYVESGM